MNRYLFIICSDGRLFEPIAEVVSLIVNGGYGLIDVELLLSEYVLESGSIEGVESRVSARLLLLVLHLMELLVLLFFHLHLDVRREQVVASLDYLTLSCLVCPLGT